MSAARIWQIHEARFCPAVSLEAGTTLLVSGELQLPYKLSLDGRSGRTSDESESVSFPMNTVGAACRGRRLFRR